jgi:hypothetical protein
LFTYFAFSEHKPEQANFQMDIACYLLDIIVIIMACLKCLIFLSLVRDYFLHSTMIPCVSMDSLIKNHVEIGEFPWIFHNTG